MRRGFRITVNAICVLLCLPLLAAWFVPRNMQRVVWWNYCGNLAHYQVATIRDGKLLLADYRETSVSPRDQWHRRHLALEPLLPFEIEECAAYLRRLGKMDRPTDDEVIRGAIYQARFTEAAAIQNDLRLYRAYYVLPSRHGIGSAAISDRWPNEPLRVTTRPANYADNLMRRLNDRTASVRGSKFFGLAYAQSTLPYAHSRTFAIPLWLLIVLLLVCPGHAAWRYLRSRRRRKSNVCPACGYDLRASPDQCPECGVPRQPATSRAV